MNRLRAVEAVVIDRNLTDEEFESLFGVADVIWACYAPSYDQASGVFGRAIQFGVPPIVREGSLIAAFARCEDVPCFPVSYGDRQSLANIVANLSHNANIAGPRAEIAAKVAEWRMDFETKLSSALG